MLSIIAAGLLVLPFFIGAPASVFNFGFGTQKLVGQISVGGFELGQLGQCVFGCWAVGVAIVGGGLVGCLGLRFRRLSVGRGVLGFRHAWKKWNAGSIALLLGRESPKFKACSTRGAQKRAPK